MTSCFTLYAFFRSLNGHTKLTGCSFCTPTPSNWCCGVVVEARVITNHGTILAVLHWVLTSNSCFKKNPFQSPHPMSEGGQHYFTFAKQYLNLCLHFDIISFLEFSIVFFSPCRIANFSLRQRSHAFAPAV